MSDYFLQFLLTAVILGSTYALIALGYTMVYGILKFINFAHSDVFVLGAWGSFTIATILIAVLRIEPGAPPWWLGAMVLVSAMLTCGVVGFLIERLAYKPLRKAPRLNVLITAIGVSLLLQNVGQLEHNLSSRSSALLAGTLAAGQRVEAVTVDQSGPNLKLVEGQKYVISFSADGKKKEVPVRSQAGVYANGSKLELGEPIEGLTQSTPFELRQIYPLQLPFGPRPVSMPTLLNARTLNETKIISGPLAVDETGDNLALGQPVTLEENRSYRIDVTYPNGRSDSLVVNAKPGEYPAGNISVAGVPDAEEVKGASFTLVKQPKVPIQLVDVAIFVSALLLMVGLDILVFRTKMGTAMRAVSFNFETAALMGINVDKVISITFVTGAVLAGGAGFLNALKYPGIAIAANEQWVLLGLKAFVAAVVGGIGNIRGAVLGGFLIAAIEQYGSFYFDPALADVYVFSVLILVLLFKPTGLLGSPVREKV